MIVFVSVDLSISCCLDKDDIYEEIKQLYQVNRVVWDYYRGL